MELAFRHSSSGKALGGQLQSCLNQAVLHGSWDFGRPMPDAVVTTSLEPNSLGVGVEGGLFVSQYHPMHA